MLNTGNRHKGVIAVARKCMFLLLLVPVAFYINAQNLVPNPSFEQLDTCPYTFGFQDGDRPVHWYSWQNSPEYFHTCAGSLNNVDTLMGVPTNGATFQYAKDGDAYVGMYIYAGDSNLSYREYVGVELNAPLEIGTLYYLGFSMNMGTGGTYWQYNWASNNLGMLFTTYPNIWTGISGPEFGFRNYAHLHSSTVVEDSVSWVHVTGTFIADSAYQYLVLGNFFENSLTDTSHYAAQSGLGAYYLVDCVCVSQNPDGCEFDTSIEEVSGHKLVVGPNPASNQISFIADISFGSTWSVFDALGRLVDHGFFSTAELELNVSDWPTGMYTFRLEEDNETFVRFIVIH